jgi:hypothetical protein
MQLLHKKSFSFGCTSFPRVLFGTVVVALLGLAQPAHTLLITINFENEPNLSIQPNNFAAAGPMQTYTSPGRYTVSGGVALGNPTFLSAFAANGTLPNLYGTTDFADPSLLSVITLDLPAAEGVFLVQGVLFNGQNIAEDYQTRAFSGLAQVDVQTFMGVQNNSSLLSFRNFSLSSNFANPITRVTVTTPNAATNGWDFFVDTVKVQAAEPSSLMLLTTGLSLLGYCGRRRGKQG